MNSCVTELNISLHHAISVSLYSLHTGSASYLAYPRINFAGYFRVDTDTRNNIPCNYRFDKPLNQDFNRDWGFNGINEFQFFNGVLSDFGDR